MVTRPEEDVGQAEDRLLRTGEDEDLLGLDPVVERGDLPTQERMPGRLRVAEGQAVPERTRLVVGEGQQVGHRVALHVGRAQDVLDGELPAGEIPFEGEVGKTHDRMMADRPTAVCSIAMTRTIALAGSPTALGGHFGGMERTPAALRAHGLQAALEARPALADVSWRDAGDAANDPGWAPDDDPWAKNRARIVDYLPRLASHVSGALGAATGSSGLLLLGGDCTSHAGAMAGIRRARPGIRLGIAWFDAHGDFNTPDTTPSGNVWGMPFAMLCGRGPADLLAAVRRTERPRGRRGAPWRRRSSTRRSRGCSPRVLWPTFGAGMLADPSRARRPLPPGPRPWPGGSMPGTSPSISTRSTQPAGWAVAMPETDGLSLEVALAAVRTIAATGPVAGFGATAALIDEADPAAATRTVDAVARLAEAALA